MVVQRARRAVPADEIDRPGRVRLPVDLVRLPAPPRSGRPDDAGQDHRGQRQQGQAAEQPRVRDRAIRWAEAGDNGRRRQHPEPEVALHPQAERRPGQEQGAVKHSESPGRADPRCPEQEDRQRPVPPRGEVRRGQFVHDVQGPGLGRVFPHDLVQADVVRVDQSGERHPAMSATHLPARPPTLRCSTTVAASPRPRIPRPRTNWMCTLAQRAYTGTSHQNRRAGTPARSSSTAWSVRVVKATV